MNINDVQRLVLRIIGNWCKTNKKPITQRVIVNSVIEVQQIPQSTVKASIRTLVRKGYLRKAVNYDKGVSYIQLRTIEL